MQILAIEKELPTAAARSMTPFLKEEAAAVWELKKQAVIRDIWFTCRDRSAVIMLECQNETEARKHLATLPLVREKFIDFEVLALKPYDGFDRLLAPSS